MRGGVRYRLWREGREVVDWFGLDGKVEGVGGGVPLGEVVQAGEREENERKGNERVSWHQGKMGCGLMQLQTHAIYAYAWH
jgi:hypothetical protein